MERKTPTGIIGRKIMARGRMLLAVVGESKKLHRLSSDTARLFYTWLLPHLDVNGCHKADPMILKSKVFPLKEDITRIHIEKILQELKEQDLIIIFGDGEYLCYPDFRDKQPNLQPHKEATPTIPFTPELLQSCSGVTPPQIKIREEKYKGHFDVFYKDYPKKVGKVAAQKSFERLKPDESLVSEIMAGLTNYKKMVEAEGREKRHILNPATFLNQRRWEDEYERKGGKKSIKDVISDAHGRGTD
jgi:hypothetical protein